MEQLENMVAKEKKSLIQLKINKLDGSHFLIELPQDRVTLSSIRKRIKLSFNKDDTKVNWKYVWSRYCLVFNNRYLLVSNMNLDLKRIGVKNQCEMKFKKINRRGNSIRGPVRLKDNERD